jgi:lipopolysaccharide/colanic/teichoic acid biosynthesis glycosyltransferase
MVPRNQEILLGKASIEEIGDYSFVNIEYTLFRRLHRFNKRIFDILFSAILLVLFSPIMIFTALSGRPQSVQYWGINGNYINSRQFNSKSQLISDLPLLWLVLLGKLSFVGSKLVKTELNDPQSICKPGLTGLASIRKVDNFDERYSILDHYYVQNQSLTLDLEIIVKSIFTN